MWKIKSAEVWMFSTDIVWEHEGEYGVTRRLDVNVTPNRLSFAASLTYRGRTLVYERLELDREVDNIYLLDSDGVEAAFKRVMDKG